MADLIELSYHGDDADRQVLDLYDAGRALYGAARFIYTLENFRVNGVIVEHATSAKATFGLHAPRPGSFIFPITQTIAAIGPETVGKLLNIPLAALAAWITRKINGDKAVDVDPSLRQAVEIEHEKTSQLAIAATRDVALRAIDASRESERRQSSLINQYATILSSIQEQRVNALLSKLRPSLIDMARPTESSATYMSLSIGSEGSVIYMDEKAAESLKGNETDDVSELTSGKFIQYNVETGWGKVRLPWRAASYRFFVHRVLREPANPHILSAMNVEEALWVWFYRVRDKSGNITSLLFQKFAAQTEIPE